MRGSNAVDFSLGRLDSNSIRQLYTVDMRLAAVLLVAIQRYHHSFPALRIRVTEGHRTAEEQEKLVAEGKSQTRNSAHQDGRAVDIAILRPARVPQKGQKWEAVWDLHQYALFDQEYVQPAALELGFDPGDILWGGHWTTLRDGVHWQLMLPAL